MKLFVVYNALSHNTNSKLILKNSYFLKTIYYTNKKDRKIPGLTIHCVPVKLYCNAVLYAMVDIFRVCFL